MTRCWVVAQLDRVRHQATHGVATPAAARSAPVRQLPLAALQRFAGNAAVAQLMDATPADQSVDPRARVDQLQLAVRFEAFPDPGMHIDADKATQALAGLTREEGRAIRTEYKRRTRWDLTLVITGQQGIGDGDATLKTSLAKADQTRLLNLLDGTVAAPTDPGQAQAAGALLGDVVAGVGALLGDPGAARAVGDQAASAVTAGVEADDRRRAAGAEASRYRAEAAQVRRAIERKQGDVAIALIRRPDGERQALATAYDSLYHESLYNALVMRLAGRDGERAAAIWIGDTVTADRIALEGDLERQSTTEADAKEAAELAEAFPAAGDQITRKRREARAAVEARLTEIAAADQPDTAGGRAAGREHLAQVLQQPTASGTPLGERLKATGDRVAAAIVDQGEPEELAARLARADVEGTLGARDLEAAMRQLRVLARRAAVREIERQPEALAPQAEQVLQVVTDGYYQRFQQRFDRDDTKRTLDKALAIGDDAQEERNRALLAAEGSLPAWRELDLALRQSPKDIDRARRVLGSRTREEVAELAEEYHANTVGNRSLETDLLGTPQERMVAEIKDRDEAAEAITEKRVLLQGGVFSSTSTDEATRLDEERKWTFGRYLALERAVMENRGMFAEARDWVGNLEKGLVDRAHADAADAASAMANALTESPPALASARASLVELRRATDRIERNLAVYKEATKAAFDEFVDLAVLAVTTVVTLGEGTAVMMAIRSTIATVGTKLALKGDDYSLDEFLMDLRSGIGAAVGGRIMERGLNPIAQKVARYAGTTGLSRGFAGRVTSQLGKAGMWEAENLVTTATGNLATNQDLTTGMGVAGHAKALTQHGVTTGIKAVTGVGKGRTGGAEEPARQVAEEGGTTARPSTGVASDAAIAEPLPGASAGLASEPTTEGGTVPETQSTVSMRLPEEAPAARRSGADRVRAVDKDGASDVTDPDAVVEQPGPHAGDAVAEPSDLGSARSRRTREEQEARAGRSPDDQRTVRTTTAPDARTEALAGEFARLFPDWHELHPTQRLERLERIVNQRLREAGVPHVFVEFGEMGAGNAAFSMREWKIYVSRESLTTNKLSVEAFAALADATSHEARHALHMFRGYRAAMAEKEFRSGGGISPLAEVAARDANDGHRTAEPLHAGMPAFDEALGIYREVYGSPATARRMRQNDRALSKAQYRVRELRAAYERTRPGSPERTRARDELRAAQRRLDRVHNTYMSFGHEVDAWRMGSSTRAAVVERVTRDRIASLEAARARAQADGARGMQRIAEREARGEETTRVRELVDDAIAREREAEQEIARLQGQLEAGEAIRRGEVAPESEAWPAHEDFADEAP